MQFNNPNIQKVSTNPNTFTNPVQKNTVPPTNGTNSEKMEGLISPILPSMEAIIQTLLEKLAIPATALKAILLTQIKNFNLKKAILLTKVVVLIIISSFFFRDELSFTLGQSGNKIAKGIHGLNESNPQAPANPASLRDTENLSFIEQYRDLAISEMEKTGIPASIKMAQAIIESRAGRSQLAVKNKNHFGIKCFSKRCTKGHCSNFSDDHHKDFFRKFDHPEGSWQEHSNFLQKSRYQRLFQYGIDYKAWANGLQACGYATDKQYGKKLIAIIEKYQLYKLDLQSL